MSIRSLTDFMEVSLRSEGRLGCTATVTGRRGPQVDTSVRGADFWWPKLRTFGGHQCGPLMAISADFLVAMDRRCPFCASLLRSRKVPKTMRNSRRAPLVELPEGVTKCCSGILSSVPAELALSRRIPCGT